MTNREFFTAVITSEVSDELKAFATEAISKLDARNAKRSAKPSKRALANAPLLKEIATLLTSEPMLASEVADALGISTQKASALLRQMDDVSVVDVKVKGKGTQKGYFLTVDEPQFLDREVTI